MPLDQSTRDLKWLAGRSRPDGLLALLARLGRSGFGLPITVVVGGTMISGNLATPEDFAADLDAKIDQGLAAAQERAPEHRESLQEVRNLFSGERSLRKQVEETRERESEREAELDKLVEAGESLSEDLELEEIDLSLPPVALNLRDVLIFPPSAQTPFSVDMVRVQLDSVGAWWIGKSEPSQG
jgi:hypothetical protein